MYKFLLIFLTIIYGLLNSSVFAQTGITFSFANVTITGTSPKFFEFDVMAQAGAGGTSIGDNLVYINYNTLGFGSNIADNAKITVTKGTLVAGELVPGFPFYDLISVQDNSSSRVAVTYELQFAGNGNALPTSATDLFHVSIEILSESENAGLSFDQGLMTGQQFEDDNSTQYSPVTASDTDDSSLPVELTSFSSEMASGLVTLKWTTESEINNLGFEIYRSLEEKGDYATIGSYKTDAELEGRGNASSSHDYVYIDETAEAGTTYWYKLADLAYDGLRTFHDPLSIEVPILLPEKFKLFQNFPNPFNPDTQIRFDVPDKGKNVRIAIEVYNLLGQKIRNLINREYEPGFHQVTWNGKNDFDQQLGSGVYLLLLKSKYYVKTQRMLLIR